MAQATPQAPQASGLVAMCGHTRRFNPSHQWVRRRIDSGDYTIQHMDVQTFFFRRSNLNALGQPEMSTDLLLDFIASADRASTAVVHAALGEALLQVTRERWRRAPAERFEAVEGVLADECRELLQGFFREKRAR